MVESGLERADPVGIAEEAGEFVERRMFAAPRALRLDEVIALQVGEVLRNFHLRLAQNILKVAHGEPAFEQEVQDPQTSKVAQALVDAAPASWS